MSRFKHPLRLLRLNNSTSTVHSFIWAYFIGAGATKNIIFRVLVINRRDNLPSHYARKYYEYVNSENEMEKCNDGSTMRDT